MTVENNTGEVYVADAVVLRRLDYLDYDVIVTLLTYNDGVITAIAKNARKSVKRFSGVLELFTRLNVVIKAGHSIAYIQEASIEMPFDTLRSDIMKMAYASYFSEIIIRFSEKNQPQKKVFELLVVTLEKLSARSGMPNEMLSIIFHIFFLHDSGYLPDLTHCSYCGDMLETTVGTPIVVDIAEGCFCCQKCRKNKAGATVKLSPGTLRIMQWVIGGSLKEAMRLRLSDSAIAEGIAFTESFLSYQLGKEPSSLLFLKKIRNRL